MALSSIVSAAELPPKPEDLVLRPGDTITWTPSKPHRLRFGGEVTQPKGTKVTLNPFTEVTRLFEISPQLTPNQDIAIGDEAKKYTAKVRADADAAGIPTLAFTCGFPLHTGLMATVPFTIKAKDGNPPRDIQIVSSTSGTPRWLLKAGADNIVLSRPEKP